MKLLIGFLMIVMAASPLWAAARPITVDDLLNVKGVSDPQLSPDGILVVYVVSELDRATDKNNSSLWLVPAAGGEPKRLTTAPGANNHPRWCPDGKTIAFVSHRGGSDQIWLLPLDGASRISSPNCRSTSPDRSGRRRETSSRSPPKFIPGSLPTRLLPGTRKKKPRRRRSVSMIA